MNTKKSFRFASFGSIRLHLQSEAESPKRYFMVLCIITAIALLLEIFVFNFKWLDSLGFSKDSQAFRLSSSSLSAGDDGSFKANREGKVTLELTEFQKEVHNLYMDAEASGSEHLTLSISATDEANANYFSLPDRTIVHKVPESQYIRLHLAGKPEKLRLVFDAGSDQTVTINHIYVNTPVPFSFSFLRFFAVVGFGVLMYLLRPSSAVHRHTMNWASFRQRCVIFLFLAVQILCLWTTTNVNPKFHDPGFTHHKQYYKLTEALLDGHVYLDEEPSETLQEMENPYDTHERSRVMSATDSTFLWDCAYYDGKYYVYFGIVPVLLLYLPFYVLTGQHLLTSVAVFLMSIAVVAGIMLLLKKMIDRWFPKTPLSVYLLLCTLFIQCGGLIQMTKRPDFYTLPIIMAIAFSLFGLCFWIDARRKHGLSAGRLLAGSVCMALVAGCRPQLLVGSAFALALFYQDVFKTRTLFSRKSLWQTLCFCLPYVVVAIGLMYYNYIRFDSPFDFGANYNLTTNDMTRRGLEFGRTVPGLYAYLFQPANFSSQFPFVSFCPFETSYMGTSITEGTLGGVFYTCPFFVLSAAVFWLRKKFMDNRPFCLACIATAAALLIVVLDTQMAGILARYTNDFCWLLCLSAVLCFLAVYGQLSQAWSRKATIAVLVLLTVFSSIWQFLTLFVAEGTAMQDANPLFYFTFQHLIAFWL